MKIRAILLTIVFNYASCVDFYTGMFKRNDFLVAQDRLYQARSPFRFTYAKYGRLFKCPITYIRVVDRLGVGRGPKVQITRGGLQKKFVTLRIASLYNQPISVNIYVGCANNMPPTTAKSTKKHENGKTELTTEQHDVEKDKNGKPDTTASTPGTDDNSTPGGTNNPTSEGTDDVTPGGAPPGGGADDTTLGGPDDITPGEADVTVPGGTDDTTQGGTPES